MITVQAIPALKDNYIWALFDENKSAVIVDPGEAAPVKKFLAQNDLSLRVILLTHHHGDHTAGAQALREEYQATVYGPGMNEGDYLIMKNFPLLFEAIPIPGHTLDHTAYFTNDGRLFSGDTLFSVGCGRVFEGTMDQMYHSLQKLKALPDDTKVYCGHEYTENNLRFAQTVEPGNPALTKMMQEVKNKRNQNQPSLPSTIMQEKATNPFLRCDIPEVKASAEKFAGQKLETPVAVFTTLRKWKDEF